MTKKILILTGISVLFCTLLFAQGTTGFETLRSDLSGRGTGMAGSMISINSGIDALFYNPAALSFIEHQQVTGTFLKHLLDIESGFLAYGRHFDKIGTFGIGLNYMNYGKFEVVNTNGVYTGDSFRPTDLLLTAGYGRRVNEYLSVGGNAKYIRSDIYDLSSTAMAFDVGGIVFLPNQETRLGFGIFNMGKTLDGFYEYKDELPLAYKVGISKPLQHLPLIVSLQVDKFTDSDLYVSAGGEFSLSDMFKLRMGWSSRGQDQKIDTDSDIFAGMSFGVGFISGNVLIDYSLVSMGELGALNRFSVGGVF